MVGLEDVKPSYDEWMYWAQVTIDRLGTITRIYAQPPHPEVSLVEKERQAKLSDAIAIMTQLHELTDEHEFSMPKDALSAAAKEEQLINAVVPVIRDVLNRLPTWSEDMQSLLKSTWSSECAGKLAHILFCGPEGRFSEGIGSGMVENGRLPASLFNLVDRELAGGERAARVEKPRAAEKHMRREELAKLWGKKNSSFLRSAGRMD
ncbi:MAG TPA: hypothetical protein DCY07_02310 [Rhodospirillaceae bacterium]|nr:hypothetical protein [Rhodospirillaceae bacterium]